jgi:hypothetical protein
MTGKRWFIEHGDAKGTYEECAANDADVFGTMQGTPVKKISDEVLIPVDKRSTELALRGTASVVHEGANHAQRRAAKANDRRDAKRAKKRKRK